MELGGGSGGKRGGIAQFRLWRDLEAIRCKRCVLL